MVVVVVVVVSASRVSQPPTSLSTRAEVSTSKLSRCNSPTLHSFMVHGNSGDDPCRLHEFRGQVC